MALWPRLFEVEFGQMTKPPCWCVDCCSQFAVSRPAILLHPKEFYQRMMEFKLQEEGEQYLEWFWLLIFDTAQGRISRTEHWRNLMRGFTPRAYFVAAAILVALSILVLNVRRFSSVKED